jgi:hypothetical protein
VTLAGRQEKALAAAHALTDAVGELLRFAREGAHYRQPPFGNVDVPELLADACKTALEIEGEEQAEGFARDDADERNWMVAACARFLDGWVP